MGAKIVFPARCKGQLSTAYGTKVYLDGVEVKEVSAVGVPQFGPDEIVTVTITVPLEDISYEDV